jgi:ferredoxin
MAVIHSIYRESGAIKINPETCKQCGICAKTCPAEVLTMNDGEVCIDSDVFFGCIACGHCMMVCPEAAIEVTGRNMSPDDLVPMPQPEEKANSEQLAALMQGRRSVRTFSDRQVETEILDRIVELASTGPMGIPPWDIGCVTIRGRDEVQKLAVEVAKGYMGFLKIFKPWVLALMRPFVGKAKYEMFAKFIRPLAQLYVHGYREGRDMVFYDAPAMLLFHRSEYADHADDVIACTYAMLAAESMIIGGAAPILQRNKVLCDKLGVPAGNKPSIVLILGYPAAKFRHTIRRRFLDVQQAKS